MASVSVCSCFQSHTCSLFHEISVCFHRTLVHCFMKFQVAFVDESCFCVCIGFSMFCAMSGCAKCSSSTMCTSCTQAFFLNPLIHRCSLSCPAGYRPDSTTRSCILTGECLSIVCSLINSFVLLTVISFSPFLCLAFFLPLSLPFQPVGPAAALVITLVVGHAKRTTICRIKNVA